MPWDVYVSKTASSPDGQARVFGEDTAPGTHAAVAELVLERDDCRFLMDVPCGSGAFTARMLDAGRQVIAVDCVDRPEGRLGEFRLGDMNDQLPAADGELDAVVSIDGIEHIEKPFDFLTDCARVLRAGGRLILSTPNISSLRSRWRWLWTGFHNKCKAPLDWANPSPWDHISMLELPKLYYMLRTRGFRVERVSTNRVKAAAWLYLPLVPFAWLATRSVFARELRDPEHYARSLELRRLLFTRAVLFGEILVISAARD